MILEINKTHSPQTWAGAILENAEEFPDGIVVQQLVGAKLERCFKGISIPNHPAHTEDKQTERVGDFAISQLVYHVTSAPSKDVLQTCAKNIMAGLRPILLAPREQKNRAHVLAQDEGIDKKVSIFSIEDFIALNIIELAIEENKNLFSILKEIVDIYNKRQSTVEIDLSLQIEVR